MTHLEDLNRIEINHLRDLLRNVKQENENLKDMNRTLQATVELYLQQQQWQLFFRRYHLPCWQPAQLRLNL